MIFKWTMFPHRSNHKYTWTPLDRKTHSWTDYVFTDKRRHSNVFYIQYFRGHDCDTVNSWLRKSETVSK
jgi:hypothetical protein